MKLNDTFRDYDGTKCHVRAIVDGMIVYRYYSKCKQRWIYKIESKFAINLMINGMNDE